MCSPELTAGMCCICFGFIEDGTWFVDDGGYQWDFHRGVCAIEAGEVPVEYRADVSRILGWVQNLKSNADSHTMAVAAYHRLVESIATEDHRPTD